MTSPGIASVQQLSLPLVPPEDEVSIGDRKRDAPVCLPKLLERALERSNMFRALKRIRRNRGAPGIDGMTVSELPKYLKRHWPEVRAQLLAGRYRPQPVLRKEIPKAGGGVRELGIPTVLDRLIQQALLQVFAVDLDLERFFDRVSHDVLMSRVKRRTGDRMALKLIDRYLKSGVMIGMSHEPTREGVPQGGPLSPLLANLLLDDLDRELERRGHRFVRYADDVTVFVKSERAGERVMSSLCRFLEKRLKLKVNLEKSGVDRPQRRELLSFSFTSRGYRRRIGAKALKAFRWRVKRLTRRSRGLSLLQIIRELRKYILGWLGYFGFTEAPSPLRDLEGWMHRRLRCYCWKQWGRRGYWELKRRGVTSDLAWNTSKSAHGPWRLSQSPALVYALPARVFHRMGLPRLVNA